MNYLSYMITLKKITADKLKVLLLVLVSAPMLAHSQEILDHAYIRANYEFSYKTDPKQIEYSKTDLMYLDIGKKASKFYSRNEQIRDSIGEEGLQKGLSAFEINELRRGYPRGTRSVYYNLQNEKKRTETSNFVFLFTYYDETIKIPQWKIENDTKIISSYNCQKATAHYLGRDWTVYFALEIPINQGPWKLWGLPGLIIQASDENNFFNYTLIGLKSLEDKIPIVFVHTTHDGKNYTKNDKTSFRKIEKLYHEDNNEFMDVYLGVKTISTSRADGSKIEGKSSIPHIPLEPW